MFKKQSFHSCGYSSSRKTLFTLSCAFYDFGWSSWSPSSVQATYLDPMTCFPIWQTCVFLWGPEDQDLLVHIPGNTCNLPLFIKVDFSKQKIGQIFYNAKFTHYVELRIIVFNFYFNLFFFAVSYFFGSCMFALCGYFLVSQRFWARKCVSGHAFVILHEQFFFSLIMVIVKIFWGIANTVISPEYGNSHKARPEWILMLVTQQGSSVFWEAFGKIWETVSVAQNTLRNSADA